MSERDPFSPAVVGFLIAGVVAIFALSVVLTAYSPDEDDNARATRSSPSAIGHVGFFTLLRKRDLPVGYSKAEGAEAAGADGLLIVQEPDVDIATTASQLDLAAGPDVLVVLPKYWGERDRSHAGWVGRTGLLQLSAVQKVLSLVDREAIVTRTSDPLPTNGRLMRHMPALGPDTQVISGRGLVPIIGTRDEMLLAEVRTPGDQHVYVLADPDPLENHGIVQDANTRFALALVRRLWSGRGSVIFDETVHGGFVETRSLLQLLFRFPYNIVLAQGLVAAALLLLATTARFGGADRPPPPFALGKMQLIDNIAALMDRAGHQAVVLRRYIRLELQAAADTLHAPPGLDEIALAGWLDRIATARGVTSKSAEILARSGTATGTRPKTVPRLFKDARDMHLWKRDLLDEPGRRRERR